MTITFIDAGTTSILPLTLDGGDQVFIFGNQQRATNFMDGNNNNVFISGIVAAPNGQGFTVQGNENVMRLTETGILAQANGGNSGTALFSDESTNLIIDNAGEITGAFGIFFDDMTEGAYITNSGRISSFYTSSFLDTGAGIANFGVGTFANNTGEIISKAIGVHAQGGDMVMRNAGEVSGNRGVVINGTAEFDLFNTGTVTGLGGTSIDDLGSIGATIRNYGDLIGDVVSTGLTAKSTVVNGGFIEGDVLLGNDDDNYNARFDGVVTGRVGGGNGDDTLRGGSRDDTMFGGGNNDIVYGRAGDDFVAGGGGADDVRGGAGDDIVKGDAGNDNLRGGSGDDSINGGSGIDIIRGGKGDDTMVGGNGADTFIFGRDAGSDLITDFADNVDTIDLSVFGLASRAELNNAGGLINAGADSIILLDAIGGDGQIYLQGITTAQLGNADFDF